MYVIRTREHNYSYAVRALSDFRLCKLVGRSSKDTDFKQPQNYCIRCTQGFFAHDDSYIVIHRLPLPLISCACTKNTRDDIWGLLYSLSAIRVLKNSFPSIWNDFGNMTTWAFLQFHRKAFWFLIENIQTVVSSFKHLSLILSIFAIPLFATYEHFLNFKEIGWNADFLLNSLNLFYRYCYINSSLSW